MQAKHKSFFDYLCNLLFFTDLRRMKFIYLFLLIFNTHNITETMMENTSYQEADQKTVNRAAFKTWYDHINKWEGKKLGDIVKVDQDDVATNHGIRFDSWSTIAAQIWGIKKRNLWTRFVAMTHEEHKAIAFWYWKKSGATKLRDGRCAAILAESFWGSYIHGARTMQRRVSQQFGVRLVADGVVGRKTAAAFNGIQDQDSLFNVLVEAYREHYVRVAGKSKGYYRNLNGWLGRLYFGSRHREGFCSVFAGWKPPVVEVVKEA